MCNAFWRPDGSFGWCKDARRGIVYQHTKACKDVAWAEKGIRQAQPEDVAWWMHEHRTARWSLRHNQKKLHSLDVPGVKRMDCQAEKELSGQERRWNDILKGWDTERSAPNVQNSS